MNDAIVGAVHKVGFSLRKHSPEILMGVGIVGGVAAAVLACKATPKAQEVLEQAKIEVDAVHEVIEHEDISEEEYSQQDAQKDLAGTYIRTGVGLLKAYGPAIALGALSIVSILASNNILRKRNVALAAAYTLVDNTFKEYRGRVVDRFGKEVDRELRYNLKAEKITETVTDENGKEKTVKKTVLVPNEDGATESGYARLFTAGNKSWENNPEMNLSYLKAEQHMFQLILERDGYLLLSDVYKRLGYRVTEVSTQVGWIYEHNNPVGDNEVKFGFEDDDAFMCGKSASVWLDFNVDGYILNRIEKANRRTDLVC